MKHQPIPDDYAARADDISEVGHGEGTVTFYITHDWQPLDSYSRPAGWTCAATVIGSLWCDDSGICEQLDAAETLNKCGPEWFSRLQRISEEEATQ